RLVRRCFRASTNYPYLFTVSPNYRSDAFIVGCDVYFIDFLACASCVKHPMDQRSTSDGSNVLARYTLAASTGRNQRYDLTTFGLGCHFNFSLCTCSIGE